MYRCSKAMFLPSTQPSGRSPPNHLGAAAWSGTFTCTKLADLSNLWVLLSFARAWMSHEQDDNGDPHRPSGWPKTLLFISPSEKRLRFLVGLRSTRSLRNDGGGLLWGSHIT